MLLQTLISSSNNQLNQLSFPNSPLAITKTSISDHWTPQEDILLLEKIKLYKGKKWKAISMNFTGRSVQSCWHRWKRLQGSDRVCFDWKFLVEDDQKILELVEQVGYDWKYIAKYLPGKNNKQIRQRYFDKLKPNLKNEKFTFQEEKQIYQLQKIYKNQWKQIGEIMNRSSNSIKNKYYSQIKPHFYLYKENELDLLTTKSEYLEITTTASFSKQGEQENELKEPEYFLTVGKQDQVMEYPEL